MFLSSIAYSRLYTLLWTRLLGICHYLFQDLEKAFDAHRPLQIQGVQAGHFLYNQ